jgi:hypothetical protein
LTAARTMMIMSDRMITMAINHPFQRLSAREQRKLPMICNKTAIFYPSAL